MQVLTNGVYYHKTLKRNLNCFSSESNTESNIKLYYTENLQVIPTDSYSATLSCAAIFVCTREEINEYCMPRMCYSAHEEEVSRLLACQILLGVDGFIPRFYSQLFSIGIIIIYC